MTDAQSIAYHEYAQSESSVPFVRTPSTQQPKLRGWRIDPTKQVEQAEEVLRHRWRRALRAAFDYGEYPTYEISRQLEREVEASEALRKEFLKHAQAWQVETSFSSSIHETVLHPSYLRIIGMGPAVLPFIFQALEKNPTHWFSALFAITGADPVPEEDRGRVRRMAQHWIKWGKQRGYL